MLKNKTILITGGSGFLGKHLTKELLKHKPKEIRIFSRNEKAQFDMENEFPDCNYIIGDVRDYHGLRNAIRGVDILIHAAAFKYLPQAEKWVRETILTNVCGTMNVIDAVLDEKNVDICLGISTDKVTNCINVYGHTKALLEKLFVQAHKNKGKLKTKFIVCRYGNVAGSSGSVIEIWKNCLENNQAIPITDPYMTRYMFTIKEAVELILWSLENGTSGEIIATEMNACLLKDLADVMASMRVDTSIPPRMEIIGRRPGEKTHECLVADYEFIATKRGNRLIIRKDIHILPDDVLKNYTSDKAHRMNKEEIRKMLIQMRKGS